MTAHLIYRRDMTAAQFRAACEKHGFVKRLGWLEDAGLGISYPGIYVDGKYHRRLSLASALQERDSDRAREGK
jgi:hypothetical protein